jgi:hypothetical protein
MRYPRPRHRHYTVRSGRLHTRSGLRWSCEAGGESGVEVEIEKFKSRVLRATGFSVIALTSLVSLCFVLDSFVLLLLPGFFISPYSLYTIFVNLSLPLSTYGPYRFTYWLSPLLVPTIAMHCLYMYTRDYRAFRQSQYSNTPWNVFGLGTGDPRLGRVLLRHRFQEQLNPRVLEFHLWGLWLTYQIAIEQYP